PDFSERQDGIRGVRGVAAIGELRTLDDSAGVGGGAMGGGGGSADETWDFDFAANDPFRIVQGAHVSTDVVGPNDRDIFVGDEVAGDAEESNLLIAGASNLVTTRSDVFTVYFRVRSFRQNRTTGVWDATDPERIVDDARYVMMVDRSGVNNPGDAPRIMYLEKLPN
ncbi:MAG: hypothetical protein HKO59_08215, partial [Phycisphaerales bacterium]|nr:hypothetical protein [Phycisphaerales bacterium]